MTLPFKTLENLELINKTVLIRQDLNVPIQQGKVTSTSRIDASLPTIEYALKQGAAVIVMSHLGRPREGKPPSEQAEYSLQPVADYLSISLNQPVSLVTDYLTQAPKLKPGQVALLENVRFNAGEKANDAALAKQYAALCDVFVMDAFGTAHRAQASTYAVAEFAPVACAGPLLAREIQALSKAFDQPNAPIVAIVGGSKVSSKLSVLNQLATFCDHIIVGGGILNTFLAATGVNVGSSLMEPSLIDDAKRIMGKVNVPLPSEVVVADAFANDANVRTVDIGYVGDDMILDVGPSFIEKVFPYIQTANTLIWNGPVGVFEMPAFSQGTHQIAQAIAQSQGFSVAGGGDTLAAIELCGVSDHISYISTGGGAFLEYLEGKILPAIDILTKRNNA